MASQIAPAPCPGIRFGASPSLQPEDSLHAASRHLWKSILCPNPGHLLEFRSGSGNPKGLSLSLISYGPLFSVPFIIKQSVTSYFWLP